MCSIKVTITGVINQTISECRSKKKKIFNTIIVMTQRKDFNEYFFHCNILDGEMYNARRHYINKTSKLITVIRH